MSGAVDVASDAAEKIAPTVGTVLEDLAPTAKAVAKAGGARSRGALQAARAWAQRLGVRPPPKPVLLALCLGALRYGLVRTALAATAAKLALDLAIELFQAARNRFGGAPPGPPATAEGDSA